MVFSTDPANSGYIECKKGNIATNQYIKIFDGEKCWATLSSFVLTTIIGAYFIPSFISYMRTRAGVKKLNYFHRQIISIYDDGNLNEEDEYSLDKLRNKITDAYSKGKLTTEHYNSLNSQMSISYEEIFKQRINSLKKYNPEFNLMVEEIEDEITDAYSKGKIIELHFKLLNEKIANMTKSSKDSS
jgi:hypothetical protein